MYDLFKFLPFPFIVFVCETTSMMMFADWCSISASVDPSAQYIIIILQKEEKRNDDQPILFVRPHDLNTIRGYRVWCSFLLCLNSTKRSFTQSFTAAGIFFNSDASLSIMGP